MNLKNVFHLTRYMLSSFRSFIYNLLTDPNGVSAELDPSIQPDQLDYLLSLGLSTLFIYFFIKRII